MSLSEFVISIAVLYLSLPGGNSQKFTALKGLERSKLVDINEQVDQFCQNLPPILQSQGLDPFYLPRDTVWDHAYEVDMGLFTLGGELHLREMSIHGLSIVQKAPGKNAYLDVRGNKTSIRVPGMVRRIKFQAKYKAQISILGGYSGNLLVTDSAQQASIEIVVHTPTKFMELKEFSLGSYDQIDVELSNAGLLRYLVYIIKWWFEGTLVKTVEGILKQQLADMIQNIGNLFPELVI